MSVTSTLPEIKPHGPGFVSTVRVRLLHASVRRRLLQLERERPGYFPIEDLGVPINDLHSIGTISAYATATVYMALPKLGIVLSDEEADDYLALWRWIGHLLGTPVDFMADRDSAKAMMESVMVAELNPSDDSRILVNNVLTAMSNVPPLYTSREMLAAQAYKMNGDDYAAALGVEKPAWTWRLMVWFQAMILLCFSYSYDWLPITMRNRRDEVCHSSSPTSKPNLRAQEAEPAANTRQRFRTICREIVLSQKLGGIGTPTRFDFQYLPNYGQMTELGISSAVDTFQAASKRHGLLGIFKIVAGSILALGVLRLGLRGAVYSISPRIVGMLVSQ